MKHNFLFLFLFAAASVLAQTAPAPSSPTTPGSPSGTPTKADEPAVNEFRLALGLGYDYQYAIGTQSFTDSGSILYRREYDFNSRGIHVFADVSSYLTLNLGLRFGSSAVVKIAPIYTTSGSLVTPETDAYPNNNITNLELALDLKYPLHPLSFLTIAPKVGLDSQIYLAGDFFPGMDFTDAGNRQILSPLAITAGVDLGWNFYRDFFVRIPVEVGLGIFTKLSDYSSYTYNTSSLGTLKFGIEVGSKL